MGQTRSSAQVRDRDGRSAPGHSFLGLALTHLTGSGTRGTDDVPACGPVKRSVPRLGWPSRERPSPVPGPHVCRRSALQGARGLWGRRRVWSEVPRAAGRRCVGERAASAAFRAVCGERAPETASVAPRTSTRSPCRCRLLPSVVIVAASFSLCRRQVVRISPAARGGQLDASGYAGNPFAWEKGLPLPQS